MMGAMLGICLVQRRLVWEGSAIGRALVGVVATPLLAVACYYLLAAVFDAEAMANDEWNATIVVTILLLVILVAFARYVRRQESVKQATKKLLLSQQQQLFENQKALNDMELKTILAENQSLHGTLELKRKEIVNVALGISEQKEFLEMLSEKVRVAAKSSSTEEKDRIIAELQNDLSQRMGSSNEIDEFYAQAEQLHKDFSVKLTEEFPNLTTSERRLATLLRLGFSSKYIATLMNISPKSVEISRYRLRQKLGLQKGDNLINFIKSI
jgi:DNA-binding CsgD family transcriptional regulator